MFPNVVLIVVFFKNIICFGPFSAARMQSHLLGLCVILQKSQQMALHPMRF